MASRFYGLGILACGLMLASCGPAPSPEARRVSTAIETFHDPNIPRPAKKAAFGDCNPRDLIHFTCE